MKKPIELLYILQGGLAVFILIMAWYGHEKYLTAIALLVTLVLSLITLTETSTPKGKWREIGEIVLYVIALSFLAFSAGKISGDAARVASSPTPKHLIWIAILGIIINFGPYLVQLINLISGNNKKTN